MRAAGLITRRRIRMKMLALIEAKTIKRSRAHLGGSGKIAALFRLERLETPLGLWFAAGFEHDLDLARFRRPDPEVCASRNDHLGSDRETALYLFVAHDHEFAYRPRAGCRCQRKVRFHALRGRE